MHRMYVLYYATAACSLSVHVVLEEIGASFEKRPITLANAQNEGPEYTKVNPLQVVPTLETEHGVLTEAAAILQYLARAHPEAKLLPGDPALARAQEWLGFLASAVHPAFRPIFRPHRFANDAAGQAWIAARQRTVLDGLLRHASARFGEGPWALGEAFSVVDAYLFVFVLWAKKHELLTRDHEPLVAFLTRALERPSVRRALTAEGLGG